MPASPPLPVSPGDLRTPPLPGQVAAPLGPVDLTSTYLVHHALRRDLAGFAAVVPRTPLPDLPTWRALLARWELFAAALRHHQHGEDAWLWPLVAARADPGEAATLRAMAAEHEEVEALVRACGSGLRRLAGPGAGADDRAALAVRLCAARESLGRHLAHEERDAGPVLQRHLAPAEREAFEARLARALDRRLALELVAWRLHEVPGDVRRELVRDAPRSQRLVWRLTRRRFARRERRAFRHAVGGAQNACR